MTTGPKCAIIKTQRGKENPINQQEKIMDYEMKVTFIGWGVSLALILLSVLLLPLFGF